MEGEEGTRLAYADELAISGVVGRDVATRRRGHGHGLDVISSEVIVVADLGVHCLAEGGGETR